MATQNWVNIGSGNGLLTDNTKQTPELILDLSSVMFSDNHLRAISYWGMPYPSITKFSLKNYSSKISFKSPNGQWVKAMVQLVLKDTYRYIHICPYTYIHTHTRENRHRPQLYMYICVCLCVCTHWDACACTYAHVHMYIIRTKWFKIVIVGLFQHKAHSIVHDTNIHGCNFKTSKNYEFMSDGRRAPFIGFIGDITELHIAEFSWK